MGFLDKVLGIKESALNSKEKTNFFKREIEINTLAGTKKVPLHKAAALLMRSAESNENSGCLQRAFEYLVNFQLIINLMQPGLIESKIL